MASETFIPQGRLTPDFGSGANWSGGTVPGLGTVAVVDETTASVDPETVIEAQVILQDGAALSGNDGGFSLGPGSAVEASGDAALYADGAIVNHGAISVGGDDEMLRVVVENGAQGIAQSYGLKVPSFENANRINVADGATLAVDGTEFSNQGDIDIDGGTLLVAGGGVDGGQNGVPKGGDITLSQGGYASFSDALAAQNFYFAGDGTLAIADVHDVSHVSIHGFSMGSAILVDSVADGVELLQKLKFFDTPENYTPAVVATANGAAIVVEAVTPCFARGTGILTPSGYVAVERLRPGDPVVTMSGAIRPVRWVGSRTIDIAAHRRPDAVRPVVVMPGAIAAGVPVRAVKFSPDHGLLLHGVLVPVKLLVNGATILRDRHCQAVSYFHVELDRHDILLAEALAAESYLDTGNRGMFENTAGTPHAAPVFGRGRQWDQSAYAGLCLGGPVLRAVRREIQARTLALGFMQRTLTDVSLVVAGQTYVAAGGGVERPIFRLAAPHPGRVMIRSAKFVPAEFGGGEDGEDDLRELGVAISGIRLGEAEFTPGELAISGFHRRAKGDPADWTNGRAVIAVPRNVDSVGLTIAALPQGWVEGF